MIDAALKILRGLVGIASDAIDPCKEAAAAKERARQAIGAFRRTGDRRYHRAFLRHRKAQTYWGARCNGAKAAKK